MLEMEEYGLSLQDILQLPVDTIFCECLSEFLYRCGCTPIDSDPMVTIKDDKEIYMDYIQHIPGRIPICNMYNVPVNDASMLLDTMNDVCVSMAGEYMAVKLWEN